MTDDQGHDGSRPEEDTISRQRTEHTSASDKSAQTLDHYEQGERIVLDLPDGGQRLHLIRIDSDQDDRQWLVMRGQCISSDNVAALADAHRT